MKIMVIVAHPNLQESKYNRAFAAELEPYEYIYVRDLYREYPDWHIDTAREQRLLLEYDRIVFQFPLYWYSSPALLKKWFDDVMTFGWAFGPGGEHLKGKEFLAATTTGGSQLQYRAGGRNWFTMSEYFRPIQGTVERCHGTFLPIFVSYATSEATVAAEAKRYAEYIQSDLVTAAR